MVGLHSLIGDSIFRQERKIIKNEKRCRNGVPKSTQTRKNKSDGKYTKPHPSLHLSQKSKDVGRGFVYLPSL